MLIFYLYVHFEDGLSDESGAEKSPERDEEVATRDSGEIEKRVGNLKFYFVLKIFNCSESH